jgi:hypothetical protein
MFCLWDLEGVTWKHFKRRDDLFIYFCALIPTTLFNHCLLMCVSHSRLGDPVW